MSHFNCRLNRRSWRSKKVVQVVRIGGRGAMGGNLDKIQKNGNFFFRETFPNADLCCRAKAHYVKLNNSIFDKIRLCWNFLCFGLKWLDVVAGSQLSESLKYQMIHLGNFVTNTLNCRFTHNCLHFQCTAVDPIN